MQFYPTLNGPQAALRQMVYLVIKELSSIAEDVIMVTSSIMKDMQPNLEVVYRPNAIRALARIIDVSRNRNVHHGKLSLSD
jgi:coatomer protein complex subunit gamma